MKRDLEGILSEIRKGRAPSMLLIHGDDLKVHGATKAILDLLVAPDKRAFNLEQFDGRTAPWETVEAALRTPPFFPGTKAVLVENAPYFYSRESKGNLREKVLQHWSEGKKDEAARLFLDLLVVAGWTQERWQRLQEPFSAKEIAELFGLSPREATVELVELLAFCRSTAMELSERRGGEENRLLELMDEGLPLWAGLLITAPQVDRRTRLYKKLEEKGAVLDLTLQRDRSGRIEREVVAEFLNRRLKESGKRIEAQAQEMIFSRAGGDLWGVHQELEKLFLYVGEGPWIRVKDVDEVFLDRGEGWIFDLTNAIAVREPLRALAHLARLLAEGEHPLRLLGTVATQVRQLLAARQLLDRELKHKWRSGMTYPEFQKNVIQSGAPLVSQNPYRDYMSLRGAENFTTEELVAYLEWIYKADIRLKSSGSPPRLVLERLILDMCQPLRAGQNEK